MKLSFFFLACSCLISGLSADFAGFPLEDGNDVFDIPENSFDYNEFVKGEDLEKLIVPYPTDPPHQPTSIPPPTTARPQPSPPPTTARPQPSPPPTTARPQPSPPPTTSRPQPPPPPPPPTTSRPQPPPPPPPPTTSRPQPPPPPPPPTTSRPQPPPPPPPPTTSRPRPPPPPPPTTSRPRPPPPPPPTTSRPRPPRPQPDLPFLFPLLTKNGQIYKNAYKSLGPFAAQLNNLVGNNGGVQKTAQKNDILYNLRFFRPNQQAIEQN